MSVSSATDTFTDSAELFDQEKYWSTVSTFLEPDPIQMEEEFKKPLNERIVTIYSHPNALYAEYRLDDVKVRAPSDAYRNYQKNQWGTIKAEAEGTSWNWTASAIGSLCVAIAGGTLMGMGLTFASSPMFAPVLLVTGLVAAAVSLFFVVQAHASISKANDQINQWDANPVLKIGRERDEAHKEGFPYIYAHNLKLGNQPSYTSCFHPKQVEHEYKKYFEMFCKGLLDQSCNSCKASWMNRFRSSNPIAHELMLYGLGDVPEYMKPVIEDYTRFESFLSDISKSYDTLKAEVRETTKERIEGYTKIRNEQLQPYAEARDTAIATAKAERDKIFEKHPLSTDKRNKDAQDNYQAIKKALEDDYSLRAGPINKKYDDKIQAAEKERDERIKKLDAQKSQQLANNYNAAHELLIRAKEAWDNKGGFQPVKYQQYFPFQAIPPVYYQQPNQQPAHPQYNQGYGYQVQQPVYYGLPAIG